MSSVISLTTNDVVGVYGYLSSKAAVSHLGRNLSVQFAPRHINVNSIAPGWFPSKMANGLIEAAGDMIVETNPRGRLGEKEDLQNLLIFLCSKQSNYINGVVIPSMVVPTITHQPPISRLLLLLLVSHKYYTVCRILLFFLI